MRRKLFMEESRCEWVDWPSSRPDTSHGALLPVILGAGAQGNPPLGCSGSPRSKGSRGRGLNSRLGREEASRTLQEWKGQSSHISLLPPCCFCCCPRARAIPNLSPSISSIHRGCPWTRRGLPPDLSRQRMWTRAAGPANSLCSHLLAQATTAISHRALLLPGTSLLSTNTPSSKDPSLTQPGIRALREPVLGLAGRVHCPCLPAEGTQQPQELREVGGEPPATHLRFSLSASSSRICTACRW